MAVRDCKESRQLGEKTWRLIIQTAWTVLSDAHLSSVCVRCGAAQLAAAALRVGCMAAGLVADGTGPMAMDSTWEVLADLPVQDLDAMVAQLVAE